MYLEYTAAVRTTQQRYLMGVTFICMLFNDALSVKCVKKEKLNREVRKMRKKSAIAYSKLGFLSKHLPEGMSKSQNFICLRAENRTRELYK
jgi:hypothetical protein